MTSRFAAAPLLALLILALHASCKPGENGQVGGDREQQLLNAVVARQPAVVERLLAGGADPNKMARDQAGHLESPWRFALEKARPSRPELIEIARQLLKAHADPLVAWGESTSVRGGYSVQRSTPLLAAVANDLPDVVRALIDHKLDQQNAGIALELAVENGQTAIVHLLVEAGVDVNTRRAATTPLVAAISTRNVALMTYLEEHGAREKP